MIRSEAVAGVFDLAESISRAPGTISSDESSNNVQKTRCFLRVSIS
jgi:hypothetical protein